MQLLQKLRRAGVANILPRGYLDLMLRFAFARIIINCIWPLGNHRNHKDLCLANASSVFVEAKDFPAPPRQFGALQSSITFRGLLFSYLGSNDVLFEIVGYHLLKKKI